MAYRIQYGQTLEKTTITERVKSGNTKSLYRIIIALAIILALTLLSRGGYLDFLIPGDKALTKEAFATMVEDVGAGTGVEDALVSFCKEILSVA